MEKTLSATQIKMFLRCPMQYQLRYIEGIKIPPKGAMLLGKSVHAGLELNYRQKIESYIDLKLDTVMDAYSDAFEKVKVEEEVNFGEDDPSKLKDDGYQCLKVYHNEVAPKIQPVMVEEHMVMEFENVEYKFQGYLDLVDTDDVIHDHKVSRKSYASGAADDDIQLTAYNLMFRVLKGRSPSKLVFDVMVRNKNAKVQAIEAPVFLPRLFGIILLTLFGTKLGIIWQSMGASG